MPVTSAAYGLRSHIELSPGTNGLELTTSYARCDQLRLVSTHRLSARRGMVAPDELAAIAGALRFVLDQCQTRPTRGSADSGSGRNMASRQPLVGESFQRRCPRWGWILPGVGAGDVRLEGSDSVELVELLGFVRDWLGGPEREALMASLGRFVGSGAYDPSELRADLARFMFLLGGDDGRLLFGDDEGD